MQKQLAAVLMLILSQIGCAHITATSRTKDIQMSQNPLPAGEIDRETASKVAKDDATKTFGSLQDYSVITCEQGAFWRVFFEPMEVRNPERLIEYVLGKRGGIIMARRDLSLNIQANEKRSSAASVSETDAIKIASRDATLAYGSLQTLEVTVCELKRTWRVVYAPNEKLNGGGPEYFVEKETGRILDKRYYQ